MTTAVMDDIQVIPSGKALGADIENIDLSKIVGDDAIKKIISGWHEHLVLRFRAQNLTDGEYVKFGRLFGELDLPFTSARGNPRRPEYPEMAVMSNIVENGKPIGGLGNFEAAWHTDMSYMDVPPSASILYAIEIPPVGGNTWFANMYAAYEALPNGLKQKIEGLTCKHDYSYNSTGELRKGFSDVTDPRTSPGAVHPIVCTHSETGKKSLFLGRRLNGYIPGMDLAESEALLDDLWAHCTKPEFTWTQHWKVGDVIVWDNRCTIHYRESFDNNSRRLLNRLQVKGTKPY
ncbi:MAG: TauD/TfdA family dioxygenase [Burkholderiales bacterium]|nr:TauD/TfdA family dioxygenase [Burkholderiales bacterium]MDP2396868.1 TauD/TfdA family dioxygenase [Burkholderiales bacterium]